MKRAFVFVSVGAMVVVLIGCSSTNAKSSSQPNRIVTLPKDLAVSKPLFAAQRFIPTNSPDLAFDTKTGSLCKTWNWAMTDDQLYSHNLSGVSTCDRLYTDDVQEENRLRYETWQHEKESVKAKP